MVYEETYQKLREQGFVGWGAENFERRMRGWNETVARVLSSPFFPATDQEILEIGSGAGDSSIPFVEKGYRVSGVEISPTAVHWAREKFTQLGLLANFIQGDLAESIPFADGQFGAVIDSACFHCLIGVDRKKALTEISRVLKPGGFLLLSHMVNDPRELPEEFSFDFETRIQKKAGLPYRTMPLLKQLVIEVTQAGFEFVAKEIKQNSWWDHGDLYFLRAS